MSADEVRNENTVTPVDDETWTTVPKKKRRGVGLVTEDHPVVKKILDFIEKIQTIENDELKHDEFQYYLGKLSVKELVVYAVYIRLSFIPVIYKYDESIGLSVDDEIKLRDLLEYEYLDV